MKIQYKWTKTRSCHKLVTDKCTLLLCWTCTLWLFFRFCPLQASAMFCSHSPAIHQSPLYTLNPLRVEHFWVQSRSVLVLWVGLDTGWRLPTLPSVHYMDHLCIYTWWLYSPLIAFSLENKFHQNSCATAECAEWWLELGHELITMLLLFHCSITGHELLYDPNTSWGSGTLPDCIGRSLTWLGLQAKMCKPQKFWQIYYIIIHLLLTFYIFFKVFVR